MLRPIDVGALTNPPATGEHSVHPLYGGFLVSAHTVTEFQLPIDTGGFQNV
jgi:hypothetical protein